MSSVTTIGQGIGNQGVANQDGSTPADVRIETNVQVGSSSKGFDAAALQGGSMPAVTIQARALPTPGQSARPGATGQLSALSRSGADPAALRQIAESARRASTIKDTQGLMVALQEVHQRTSAVTKTGGESYQATYKAIVGEVRAMATQLSETHAAPKRGAVGWLAKTAAKLPFMPDGMRDKLVPPSVEEGLNKMFNLGVNSFLDHCDKYQAVREHQGQLYALQRELVDQRNKAGEDQVTTAGLLVQLVEARDGMKAQLAGLNPDDVTQTQEHMRISSELSELERTLRDVTREYEFFKSARSSYELSIVTTTELVEMFQTMLGNLDQVSKESFLALSQISHKARTAALAADAIGSAARLQDVTKMTNDVVNGVLKFASDETAAAGATMRAWQQHLITSNTTLNTQLQATNELTAAELELRAQLAYQEAKQGQAPVALPAPAAPNHVDVVGLNLHAKVGVMADAVQKAGGQRAAGRF